MFARKLQVELAEADSRRPAPKEWMDQFFMRNFIGHSALDETLVTGEGEMETGSGVEPASVQKLFEQWLRGRKLIGPGVTVVVRARG